MKITLDEFEAFIRLPENIDRHFEFINGQIVEKLSTPYASAIAANVAMYLVMAARKHQSGHVTGQAGGYTILRDRYIPDCAFISYARQSTLPCDVYFVPNPPELAVEVMPHAADSAYLNHLRLKLAGYMAAGVIVWIVDAETQHIEVYHPGEPSQQFDVTGTLTVEALLPGFELPVKDIFPDNKSVNQ